MEKIKLTFITDSLWDKTMKPVRLNRSRFGEFWLMFSHKRGTDFDCLNLLLSKLMYDVLDPVRLLLGYSTIRLIKDS